MKRILYSVTLIFTMLQIIASPECIYNNRELTESYDHKNYQSVQCNCPCEKRYPISAKRGKCTQCEHFRVPKLQEELFTIMDPVV